MTQLTPEMTLLLASSTGVGVLMMRAGIEKKMLEWRRRERICAGCGKHLSRPVCTCASS
jgi:NADH pyrophosphatase NudC (nudix superfamily)